MLSKMLMKIDELSINKIQLLLIGLSVIAIDLVSFYFLLDQGKAFSREEKSEKLSRLRKTISERLVYAKNSTAMLTTFNEVDMGPILNLREKYRDSFYKKYGVGLGFMSFFGKACALALQKFPAVNAQLDVENGNIIYFDYVDISIAVSTPKGLVVPVIRNAESLSMDGIEKEVKRLAVKGRNAQHCQSR